MAEDEAVILLSFHRPRNFNQQIIPFVPLFYHSQFPYLRFLAILSAAIAILNRDPLLLLSKPTTLIPNNAGDLLD